MRALSARGAAALQRASRIVERSGRLRRIGLALALLLFAGGVLLSWRRLAPIDLRVWPVVINAALVPLSVGAAAWQVRLIARLAGVDPGLWKSVRVTSLGTLSSVLPVSSGTLVRGGSVLYWGATKRETTRAFIVDFLLWLAASLLIAGSAAFWLGHGTIGWSFLLGGAAALPIAHSVSATSAGGRWLSLQLFFARCAGVIADIPRLVTAFAAAGFIVSAAQAAILTAPAVLSSIFFFLPGGFGVREGLTAFFGSAIGLSAAAAFLAAAINRVIGLSVLVLGEALLWVYMRMRGATTTAAGSQ